jgi:hypothetical protein
MIPARTTVMTDAAILVCVADSIAGGGGGVDGGDGGPGPNVVAVEVELKVDPAFAGQKQPGVLSQSVSSAMTSHPGRP